MIMPVEQPCPECGSTFTGSDCLGDPCPHCRKKKHLKHVRVIPERTEITYFSYCEHFVTMDERYRAIREKMGGTMLSCWGCKHKFENGEQIYLGIAIIGSNRTFCETCGEALRKSVE